jgi:hypothetical protein
MSGKKHRKLRKELGMSKKNLRDKDYVQINKETKVVYFKNRFGDLKPVETERSQIINGNLNFYRKKKKEMNEDVKKK